MENPNLTSRNCHPVITTEKGPTAYGKNSTSVFLNGISGQSIAKEAHHD